MQTYKILHYNYLKKSYLAKISAIFSSLFLIIYLSDRTRHINILLFVNIFSWLVSFCFNNLMVKSTHYILYKQFSEILLL